MPQLRLAVVLLALAAVSVSAQSRKPAAPVRRAPARALPALQTAAAAVDCPAPLGVGLTTREIFCDVLTGRDPATGIIVRLPPHSGQVTLTFNLHNRHTYSEEEVRQRLAYRRYTATIGVLTMDNTLISRAIVQSEFRGAIDLVDRVSGGAGPTGVKAVAPTGSESITVTIPEDGGDEVSVLGEKLVIERLDDTTTYTEPGRPIANISRVMIEFRPPLPKPAPRPARKPVKLK